MQNNIPTELINYIFLYMQGSANEIIKEHIIKYNTCICFYNGKEYKKFISFKSYCNILVDSRKYNFFNIDKIISMVIESNISNESYYENNEPILLYKHNWIKNKLLNKNI